MQISVESILGAWHILRFGRVTARHNGQIDIRPKVSTALTIIVSAFLNLETIGNVNGHDHLPQTHSGFLGDKVTEITEANTYTYSDFIGFWLVKS